MGLCQNLKLCFIQDHIKHVKTSYRLEENICKPNNKGILNRLYKEFSNFNSKNEHMNK